MSSKAIVIAAGGTSFDVSLRTGADREFLGRIEVGDIDSDGQWVGDNSDVIAQARESFALLEDLLDDDFEVR